MTTASAILFAALAFPLAVFAADQPSTTEDSAVVAKPAAATVPAVGVDADAALQRARELAGAGGTAAELAADTAYVQREERGFASLLQRYLDASPADLVAMRSLELRQASTAAALSLGTVQERRRKLAAAIVKVRNADDEIDASHDQWTRQLEAEQRRGSPPALLERLTLLLRAIEESRDDLRARSQALLQLDNRLAALQERLTSVSARLDDTARSTRRLFSLTESPLWKALSTADGKHATALAPAAPEWRRATQTMRQFWENYSGHIVLHFVVLGLLFGVTVSLSSSPALRALEPLAGSVRVLNRPISSATVIAIALSPAFYPELPLALVAVVRLASVVPVWRLIPTFVPPAWSALFYSVAGLFGVETVINVLPEDTVLSRLALLFTSVGALWIATIGVNRRLADAAFADWRWARIIRSVQRLVVFLLLSAILANLLGAMDLALLLNFDVVAPAYLAIGLVAVVFAVEDSLRLTLYAKNTQRLRSVARHGTLLLRRGSIATRWLVAILWVVLTLRLIGLDTFVVGGVGSLLAASTTVGALHLSLGDILIFVAAVWVSVLSARFVAFVLENDVLPHMHLARGVPGTITTTARYLIIGVGLLIAASIAGIDVTKVTIILGALSVGIGFGLQTVVNNFISGIILLFERPIQVGDTIQVGDLFGIVRSIGIRASTVRTYAGAEVIVPNAELISSQVINWTLSDRYRRLELDVGVAYGNRPADIIGILEELVRNHEAALKIPAPAVRFCGFGESSLDFRIYVWVDFDEGVATTSAILSAVYDRLAEAGVEIPFPQRDLHLRSVSESASRTLRGETR